MTLEYTVNSTDSRGKRKELIFTDPKAAGVAFYNVHRSEMPSVTQSQEDWDAPRGRFVRFMAGSLVSNSKFSGDHPPPPSCDEGDKNKYYKNLGGLAHSALPEDREFCAGYFEALESTVVKQLKLIDWRKVSPGQPVEMGYELQNDLATAIKYKMSDTIWHENVPSWVTPPKGLEFCADYFGRLESTVVNQLKYMHWDKAGQTMITVCDMQDDIIALIKYKGSDTIWHENVPSWFTPPGKLKFFLSHEQNHAVQSTPEGVSAQQKIIESIAKKLLDDKAISSALSVPALRQIKEEAARRGTKLPGIPIYDKNAPSSVRLTRIGYGKQENQEQSVSHNR